MVAFVASTRDAEPEDLSIPFLWGSFVSHSFSCRELGSHESWVRSDVHAAVPEVTGSRVQLGFIEIKCFVCGFIKNTIVLVLHLHKK